MHKLKSLITKYTTFIIFHFALNLIFQVYWILTSANLPRSFNNSVVTHHTHVLTCVEGTVKSFLVTSGTWTLFPSFPHSWIYLVTLVTGSQTTEGEQKRHIISRSHSKNTPCMVLLSPFLLTRNIKFSLEGYLSGLLW